jgi:hypothetical protein
MDPQLIKNVLSLPIMILMVLILLAIISILITNTVYYKKLWDEDGSESISEESAKVFFFLNLFLAIASGIVFFIFLYRWYKLYNLTNMELQSLPSNTVQNIMSPVPRRNISSMMSPIGYDYSPMNTLTPDMKNTTICNDLFNTEEYIDGADTFPMRLDF